MARIVYVNGRYVDYADATVHVEDRGYQFSDGVYEVVAVHRGAMVDEARHLDRLERSLAELRMAAPVGRRALAVILREVLRRNRIAGSGMVYVQVTRGVAPRNHAFPKGVRSALVVLARPIPAPDPAAARAGVAVITIPDIRWQRRDIKTVSLLPNALGRQQAIEAGAYDAWMVEADGTVTEGTASNAWIVTADGELVTRRPDHVILNGITRRAALDIVAARGIRLVERPFTVAEAKAAAEAFLTSTTSLIKPVVRIDGQPVGDGAVGPVTESLLALYLRHMDDEAGPGR